MNGMFSAWLISTTTNRVAAWRSKFDVARGCWRPAPLETRVMQWASPHLHYAVLTLIPYPWRWDGSAHGWMWMFYLAPGTILSGAAVLMAD